MFQARVVVKYLRTEKMTKKLKQMGLNKPKIDVATRWSSTAVMLQSLVDAKVFCKQHASHDPKLHLSSSEWDKIEQSLAALEPMRITTLSLQEANLLPGDFFATWLRCKLRLNNVKNSLAKALLAAMTKREPKVVENDVLLAAIYLDPRYLPLLLTDDPSIPEHEQLDYKARQYLLRLHERIRTAEPGEATETLLDEVNTRSFLSIEWIFFKELKKNL